MDQGAVGIGLVELRVEFEGAVESLIASCSGRHAHRRLPAHYRPRGPLGSRWMTAESEEMFCSDACAVSMAATSPSGPVAVWHPARSAEGDQGQPALRHAERAGAGCG